MDEQMDEQTEGKNKVIYVVHFLSWIQNKYKQMASNIS